MSDRMPEDLPDRMPEDMPEHMPEDMPDRMPNRMSEDMSDRMLEDLPVRKCINVMVGIIRSEVIPMENPPFGESIGKYREYGIQEEVSADGQFDPYANKALLIKSGSTWDRFGWTICALGLQLELQTCWSVKQAWQLHSSLKHWKDLGWHPTSIREKRNCCLPCEVMEPENANKHFLGLSQVVPCRLCVSPASSTSAWWASTNTLGALYTMQVTTEWKCANEWRLQTLPLMHIAEPSIRILTFHSRSAQNFFKHWFWASWCMEVNHGFCTPSKPRSICMLQWWGCIVDCVIASHGIQCCGRGESLFEPGANNIIYNITLYHLTMYIYIYIYT